MNVPLHNLHSFIDTELLKYCYYKLKRKSAKGVDGESWLSYGKDLDNNLSVLLNSFRNGTYRAPAVRRTYLPKGNGKSRPIGIPTIGDKVLQSGVKFVLEIIYEESFKDFSYGFRPRRSQHQAINHVHDEVSYGKIRYIIDADIQHCFGELDHSILRRFLDKRIKDGVIRKMIDKWLKAGVLENGQLTFPTKGTPQGGVISPLLSNIYLHYVLDEWFSDTIQFRLKGQSMIVRFADDFVLGFCNKQDAERVLAVLGKRLGKYGLKLHPEKTKLLYLGNNREDGKRSFDFLGFRHYLAYSRKGKLVLKRKTSSDRFVRSMKKVKTWIKSNRTLKLPDLVQQLNRKLRGHYNYYGITYNFSRLVAYYKGVKSLLAKWLNRRGGKGKTWVYYQELFDKWCPLLKPRIYHSTLKAKP